LSGKIPRIRDLTPRSRVGIHTNTIRAILLVRDKKILADGSLVEMVVWRLPGPTPDRPHGLKYRFFSGRGGKCLIRYDNESGKGDHRHFVDIEEPYRFESMERLIRDFLRDVESLGG